VLIWGLVLAKARSGLEAVETKDTSKVSGLLSRVASLIGLIICASVFKLVASLTEPKITPTVKPLLKQSFDVSPDEEHPSSYYDESSPHYLGGAHNVALQQLREGNVPTKYAGDVNGGN